jgi:hypothetical protein
MNKDSRLIRALVREEIGRNFHTVNNDPYSFLDYSDYEVDIIPMSPSGYLLSVSYNNYKLGNQHRFPSRQEAELYARKIVEKHRLSNEK